MTDLIQNLKDELDAATLADVHDATNLVHGHGRPGIMAKYFAPLDRDWVAGKISERLHGDIKQRMADICSFVISTFVQPSCMATGWSPIAQTKVDQLHIGDREWARDFAQRVCSHEA